ncbi:hypothetical protein F0562_033851 [Nyssa sinensis]|uniref:Uncharacterized protein n=1 Tax=Nyssa sinensis TaxID=561372 RepID=A0A5J5AFH4_9ASTE|nr:hypothetical protein F0562_033851 [Nyssa sinensis]
MRVSELPVWFVLPSTEVEKQLEILNQRLEELQKEISQIERSAEEKQQLVSKLQEKSEKLEDALTAAKKFSSHHQMHLTKLAHLAKACTQENPQSEAKGRHQSSRCFSIRLVTHAVLVFVDCFPSG